MTSPSPGPSPTEIAARTYVAAWQEHDPAARARLIEACWAEDGRIATGGVPIVGRAGLEQAIVAFHADPRRARVILLGTVEVLGPIFRLRGIAEAADGTRFGAAWDFGEVGPDGRIRVIITFPTPWPED